MTVCGNKMTGVCAMGKCPYIKACNSTVWDKSPHKRMSNEEWLRQASTEELAEWIKAVIENCRDCGRSKKIFMTDCPFGKYCAYDVIDWMKEVHKE